MNGRILAAAFWSACAFTALQGRARAADACAAGSGAFMQAEALFTQAETASPNEGRAFWQKGMALVTEHRDDAPPPACSDGDEYTLLRARTILHGLDVGYRRAGQDVIKARTDADVVRDQTLDEMFRRHPNDGNVFENVRKRWPDLYDASRTYARAIDAAARQELIARHTPSGPDCAYPFLDAAALDIVTPDFPEDGKNITHAVSVLIAISIDDAGRGGQYRVLQSSGKASFDAAALDAAKKTTLVPKIVNCRRVEGTYVFRSTFDPNL